mgnify:CR=1 FL=1
MPQLPSVQNYGARPIPQPQGGIPTPRNLDVVGRANEVAANQTAQTGARLAKFGEDLQNSADQSEYAYARSAFLRAKVAADDAFLTDMEYITAPQRYETQLGKELTAAAGAISNKRLRQDFLNNSQVELARGVSQQRIRGVKKEQDIGLGALDLTVSGNLDSALRTNDSTTAVGLMDAAANAIHGAVARGWLSEQEGVNRRQKLVQDFSVGRAEALTPEARVQALQKGAEYDKATGQWTFPKIGAWQDMIPSAARTKLLDTAQREVEQNIRFQIALEDRNNRLAEKVLRDQGDELAKEGWTRWKAGTLDMKWLNANRGALSQADHQALIHGLSDQDPVRENPETLSRLTRHLATDDPGEFETEASLALSSGQIKSSTYSELVSKNRAAAKDDRPASPYRSGRSYVDDTLRPPTILQGAAQDAASFAHANALSEFDDWAEANPRSTRAQTMDEARAIARRYQIIQFDQMSLGLGLPRFYSGQRALIAPIDLDAAETLTLRELDAGRLSQEQAQNELTKLGQWRSVLSKKPAPTVTK